MIKIIQYSRQNINKYKTAGHKYFSTIQPKIKLNLLKEASTVKKLKTFCAFDFFQLKLMKINFY